MENSDEKTPAILYQSFNHECVYRNNHGYSISVFSSREKILNLMLISQTLLLQTKNSCKRKLFMVNLQATNIKEKGF